MTSYLDRLNLRPFEKRLVVFFGIVLFIVINAVFVWPYFKEWKRVQTRMRVATANIAKYNTEINQAKKYEAEVKRLQGEGEVPPQDQLLQLTKTIQNQALQSGIQIDNLRPNTRTNQNFLEQITIISVTTGEEQLVDFLYRIGTGTSMIRVRDMGLRPNPSGYKLNGQITLVASYQRKTTGRPTAPGRRSASATAPARPVRSSEKNR